jgi:stage V sporulation protein G
VLVLQRSRKEYTNAYANDMDGQSRRKQARMKITKVEFFGEQRGNFLRYAVIVIDSALVIRGIKIIQRPDTTILIAMPSRKKIDETHEDIVHPINSEARDVIEKAVLLAWSKYPRAVVEK